MNWLLQLLAGGGLLSKVTEELGRAYELKLKAETDKDKLEADTQIAYLEGRRSVLLEEQKRWYTAWIRPMMALPVVIYMWKIVVWDTVLQWGVTPNPGEFVNWIVITVIGAYFLTRPFERR